MKKYIKYIISLSLGVLIFSSCKKGFLKPIPQASVTDLTAFDTPFRISNQVTSLYQALKNGSFFGGRTQIDGDIPAEDFINETTNFFFLVNGRQLNSTLFPHTVLYD